MARRLAPAFEQPVVLERDGVALVFGMEWFPLLGAHADRQAAALARRRRAVYRVVSAGEAASVGLFYESVHRSGGLRLCSAAAVFAATHRSGTTAAIVAMPDGRRWLVAVHEAAVITLGDCCLDTEAGVQEALARLREAHPGLLLYSAMPADDLLNDLFQAATHTGQLIRSSRFAAVWRPVFVTVAMLMVFGIALEGSLLSETSGTPEAGVDPHQVWAELMADLAQRHTVQGVAGSYAVYEALLGLPAALDGWALSQVECLPQANRWQCRAQYRRLPGAVNRGLLEAAPQEWALTFDPMDGAEALWFVPMPSQPLSSVVLRAASQNDMRLVSTLQEMLPAFSELRVEASRPVPFRAPLDARRQAVPRPRDLTLYHSRVIRLQAPLRSVSLLLPEMAHMSWERVALKVTPNDQPSLRNSGLRITLTGMLYEIDDPNHLAVRLPESGPGKQRGRRDGRVGPGATDGT